MRKYRKAQHLVEFALVTPVIIIIFLFIVEIGFIISTKIALAEAVRDNLSKVNELAGNSKTDIKISLENSIKTYISSHNLPNSNTITVDIFEPTVNDGEETALVCVNYKYHSFLNFLDFSGQNIFPAEFNFSSYQVINSSLLKNNDYSSAFSSADLDSFSKDSSILTNQTIDGMDFRYMVGFLIGFDIFSGTDDYNYARLFNWWGDDLLPPNLAINVQTGHLEVKSPYYNGGDWFDTKIPYTWVFSSLGLTHVMYSKINNNPAFVNYKLNLANPDTAFNLNIPLFGQGTYEYTGDITVSDNVDRRAFTSSFDGIDSFGSFDPISSLGIAKDNLKNYTFNYNDKYVLKLSVPCNTRPEDSYNGYRFKFGLVNGMYDPSGASVDIIDCYIDSDGDGIPDAWDGDPQYPDADGNGIPDGEQIVQPVFTGIDDIAIITSQTGSINIAPPFKMDSSLNSVSNTHVPAVFTVNYGTSGGALYFQQSGTTYTRKMPLMSTLAEKEHFIHGTSDGSTINLNRSSELDILDDNTFSTLYKVIR